MAEIPPRETKNQFINKEIGQADDTFWPTEESKQSKEDTNIPPTKKESEQP